ncbi:MAG: ABC transporter ATP-binding protein [bacterium]|nr:ABC transporter ATP-binding protein [bacterium]
MKKEKIAISIKDLFISYRDIKKFSIRKTLFSREKTTLYTAIRGVSFDIKKGEIVGICGKNGSGKSTLLRAIAGIFSADKGTINLNNNSVSLLSIGVGFQKKLTGYDNIFLSGMLLGFSKEQIDAKLNDIIEFSELGDFIYKPVSSYSSGMYSKLAFSITAILETDIMLIDEVLSVGDVAFKEKSYNKMKELISDENRTVVIVSHSSKTLEELCDRVIWLHEGKILEDGKPEEVVSHYEEFIKNQI